jgi:hypothetical protein
MQRVFEVTKLGGRLYLAIENRYWGGYFTGARDLHVHRPWLSVLPRRIARMYSILRFGEDYRAFCYSLTEYVNLFQKLGYRSVRVDYPLPDYVQPKEVQPLVPEFALDQKRPFRRKDIERNATDRHAARFGRSFMFFAQK